MLGLAAGYEDLNDHYRLRDDSALALASGCIDVTGEQRLRERDRGHVLAVSSTLNRLELGDPGTANSDRNKKILADDEMVDTLLVDLFWTASDGAVEELENRITEQQLWLFAGDHARQSVAAVLLRVRRRPVDHCPSRSSNKARM